LAVDAAKLGDSTAADRLSKEALAAMDAALQRQPNSPGLLWRRAQILANIVSRGAVNGETEATRDARIRSIAQVAALATAALNAAPDDDLELVPMAQFAAAMHQRAGNVDAAEQMYKSVLKRRPSEPVVILQLVDQIRGDSSRQDEVIKLYESAAAPPAPRPGLRGMLAKESQQRAVVGLLDLRLEKFFVLKGNGDPTADAMIPPIEAELNRLAQTQGSSPNLMRIRGKMQLFRGNTEQAIELLNRALVRVTDASDRLRYDIMYLLGRAHQKRNNSAEAEKMYAQIVDRIDFVPARIELARLLIARAAYPEARPHIEMLSKSAGDNADVIQMQMVMLEWEGRGDAAAMDALLQRMPEDDATAKVQKVRVALAARRAKIALAVILPLYEQYKDDSRLVLLVSTAHEVDANQAEALAVLKEYDARRPNIDAVKKAIARLEK
jgi:tetratricopeptide (TPR) repeat protein